jgi:phage regulator Rha-like protein
MKYLTTTCKAGRGTPASDKTRSTPHAAGPGDSVSKQADSTQSNLVLTTTTTEPRVDSRMLAPQLGNKHRHVMALLDKYLDVFKKHGHVSFKNADGERKQGGGKAERYALLNENQAYFLLSLSRNNEIVVALKSKLITAFSDARHASDLRRTESAHRAGTLPQSLEVRRHPGGVATGPDGTFTF